MLPMLHITGLLAVPTVQQGLDAVKADPAMLAVLIVVGILAAALFVFGLVRRLFMAAILAGLLSAGAWYWYFNIR